MARAWCYGHWTTTLCDPSSHLTLKSWRASASQGLGARRLCPAFLFAVQSRDIPPTLTYVWKKEWLSLNSADFFINHGFPCLDPYFIDLQNYFEMSSTRSCRICSVLQGTCCARLRQVPEYLPISGRTRRIRVSNQKGSSHATLETKFLYQRDISI